MRGRLFWGRGAAVGAFCVGLLQAGNALAFKTGTHAAAANEVIEQLQDQIDASGGTLVFTVNGRRLDLNVTEAEAFQAVVNHPNFFRAGVIGPDGFPDPITGQIMMHGDESDIVKDMVEAATGQRPPDHPHTDHFEVRSGPSEYRSIDFVTAMLEFFATYPADTVEREQIIAFIVGYISHGVGDGFAHTWVNQLAGGAWSFSQGHGMWGTFSEEIKHFAVETMVDALVPDDLKSVPGDQGGQTRIQLEAPVAFLDAFYSSQALNSQDAPFPPGGSINDWLTHYRNFNIYNGGFFYNYFNAQTHMASTLKSWSGLGGFFDLAEDINDNVYVNMGLDVAQLPEDVSGWLAAGPNPIGWIDELTGGFVDCHADNIGNPLPTPITDMRAALALVGGVNDRIGVFQEKAVIVRRNWIRLAECTAENMARAGAADFDPDNPGFNRDACADVVRAGWTDQGNEAGLYRGTIRPRANVANIAYVDLNEDEKFLLDLKAAFLGNDADDLFLLVNDPINNHSVWKFDEAMEGKNGHRSIGSNLSRMLDYVSDFGFRGDELDEVLLPEDQTSLRDTFDSICSAARDEGFENCLDLAFAPIAAAGRSVVCIADHAACTAESVSTCLSSACMESCGGPFSNSDCADLCGDGTVSGCKDTCDDWFCITGCIPGLGCQTACEPVSHSLCNLACDVFSSEDQQDTCLAAAVDEAVCGVENVVCEYNNLVDTITLDNYAEELLTPIREACDTVDDALELFECLQGDPNLPVDQQRANRRACVVQLCAEQSSFDVTDCNSVYDQVESAYDDAVVIKEAVGDVIDALSDGPPHQIVNMAFLEEDLKRSNEYRQNAQDNVNQVATNWANNPPPPGAPQSDIDAYNARGNVINRWQQYINNISNLGTSSPLADFAQAASDGADLIRDSRQLGLIPSAAGPTAQDIYGDIGPVFRTTFLPFFNTLQGMKLAPLHRDDIADLFAAEAPESVALLPYNNKLLSPSCDGAGANPYCDVLISFDDPNCIDCPAASLLPDPDRFGWVPGRSIVAWNDYDPSNTVQHITTAFPFANSDESYDSLYTRIFQVPSGVPGFAGFDDEDEMWTSDQVEPTINNDNFVEGTGSMQVDGCQWARIDSPTFNTTDWGVVGDQLLLDVYIPAEQSNTDWIGDVQLFVTIPAPGLNNQPLGWNGLTNLSRPGWHTLSFPVPANIQDALLGDFANAQFGIQLTYSGCNSYILFDNLRFAGNLRQREVFHLRGSEVFDVTTNPLFSFDDPTEWDAGGIPVTGSDFRVEGTGSLAVPANNWVPVTSRPFDTSELSNVTQNLSVDVFLPEPQPNVYYSGWISLSLSCPNVISSAWLGQASLTNTFQGEFNTLEITLAPDIVAILQGNNSGCTISVNVNATPSGTILLDNMGFH